MNAPPTALARPLAVPGADPDETPRVRLGASTSTPAEILLTLAADPAVTVRAALALNPAAPPATFDVLARDDDERVRALLAHKLASLAPGLDAATQSHLRDQAIAALTHLVEDEAIRVRAAITEVVKEMADAPRELVMRLARDTALSVSEPVIRLSPMLSQADLLALLATAASPAVALAVAHRPDLTEPVADAIAASSNAAAIRALLANHSAQIRESTLDALIALAVDHTDWHEPLVHRPSLSPRAAQALSEIVADTLLAALANRADLGRAVAAELRARLVARLARAKASRTAADPGPVEALSEARTRAFSGRLTEAELLKVIGCGESQLAAAMLAVAADVPFAAVQRATSLRSAKGLVSLVWKAGFGMKTAMPMQTLLARLAPGAVLTCGPGGTFPLSIEEMRWQIDFLSEGT